MIASRCSASCAIGNLFSLAELQGEEGQYLRFLAPGILEAVAGDNLDVIRQLEKIANLEQLAALELQANKVIRTNASKALEQTDLTSTGVALLKAPIIVGDRILYATGPDTFATSPLPPWSRTFLASPDAQEQRRIISASRPVFKAHLAANQLVYNGTTSLSFTASPLNVGNCWSGGTFTAPEAGMYFFSMGTTMGDGYGGQFIVQIFVNGGVYSEMVYPMNPQSGQQYYRAGTLSAALQLAAGGTVQFKLVLDAVQGNPMMQAFRNFATGFLI
ncbi:hypothetical protein BR141012304_11230 [Brucella inopinata]|nr:hypothetical protein BR141012304_11230 [Brucella inopinata]